MYTPAPGAVTINNETRRSTDKDPAVFIVRRAKDSLRINFGTDSMNADVIIRPHGSFAYYANVLFLYGIPGFIIDDRKPKRYSYPRHIYIDTNEKKGWRNISHARKGALLMHVSLPYINIFEQRPEGEGIKYNTGFLGISTGLDYYYSKSQYLSLTGSAAMDLMLPFPAPIDYFSPHEQMYSTYLSLTNNHKIGRFSLGYGLAYGNNLWRFEDRSVGYFERKSNTFLGFSAPVYCRIGRTFHLGFIYRPSFLNLNTNTFQYEHLMSIDFAWKFALN